MMIEKEFFMQISEMLQLTLKQIRPILEEDIYLLEPRFLQEGPEAVLADLHAIREKVKSQGLWAPHLPEAYGGMGLSLVEFAHISEALGRSFLGHYAFNCQAPDIGNMEILMEYGTDDQKEAFLKPLMAGDIRSCVAMTEPEHAGSNPTQMSATAIKDGDDYVINGHKWFTTGADGAAFTIVMALTDPDSQSRHQRASQIIVPLDTPGFRIVRNLPVMGDAGSGNFSHPEVVFENCRVPQSNRLGPENAGFAIAQERLGPGRIHHCMRWIGICERAFDLMCTYAVSRELSPGKPLASRQLVQAWIAECRAEINASRLMVLDTAKQMDAHGAPAVREQISLIKFYVAGVLQKVLDCAIQTHGALGMTDYLPLAFWYRHERAARIYDGADEVHKAAAARSILKRYTPKESSDG
jgi:alkylation response protein AidB-like acyl-CoA dehydrogenase